MSVPRADKVTVTKLAVTTALLLASLIALSGCTDSSDEQATTIVVWAHDGTDEERTVLEDQVARFNASQADVTVSLELESEGSYNDVLQAAAAGRSLPDVAEVDGPLLASYVYQEALVPLDGLISSAVLDAQLPSVASQGEFDGRRYAVGTFDSGLGLYADRRALRDAGVDWPRSIDDAWSAAEFSAVLRRLAETDPDQKVLDVKANYGVGEWMTYGFAPLVASAGGTLIDADTLSPLGRLDGDATIRALDQLRAWSRFVDPNDDDQAFIDRRVPLSWVGHWAYPGYSAALGRNLLVLPLPDLGQGAKTGQGSWTWTVTAREEDEQAAAARFLEFLLSDTEVRTMSDANGAVPGTVTALQSSPLYSDQGPLHLFAEQLLRTCAGQEPVADCVAVPRPRTPGYGVLSGQFAEAVAAAIAGKDPEPLLKSGASYAHEDLLANDGFRAQ